MPGGKPLSRDGKYAQELGISYKALIRLGGADRLQSMAESARKLLVGMVKEKRA